MDDASRRKMILTTRVAVPLLLVLAGAGIYFLLQAFAPEVETVGPDRVSPQVRVFESRRVPVQRQWRGYGTAEAKVSADVPARVGATVVEIPEDVEAGQRVEAGQLLVRLDASDYLRQAEIAEQNLAQLQVQLAQLDVEERRLRERLELEARNVEIARREVERTRALVARGAANEQDLDAAERALIQAERSRVQLAEAIDQVPLRREAIEAQIAGQQSALQTARENVRRTEITSPIGGVLQTVDVEEGESVAAGQRVARVVAPEQIEIPLRIPAEARGMVEPGSPVRIEATSGEDLQWRGQVVRIAPEDDADTRTTTVFVEPTGDAADFLYPGRFVEATIAGGEARPRWVVPRRSIRSGRLFVVDGGVVRSVPVAVDYGLEGRIEAIPLPDDQWAVLTDAETSRLEAGDLVVINASSTLAAGQRVTPVRPEPLPPDSGTGAEGGAEE